MTNQQKGLNVLTVLAIHAEMRAVAGKPNLAKELREVHAAVAELIEAAQEVRGWIPHGPWFTDAPRAAVSRFDAAVARVQGGA